MDCKTDFSIEFIFFIKPFFFFFSGKSCNHVYNKHNTGSADRAGWESALAWRPSSEGESAERSVGEDLDARLDQTNPHKPGTDAFIHPREDLVPAEVTRLCGRNFFLFFSFMNRKNVLISK